MDALLSSFLAALIAEQGSATQLLVLAALARFGRSGPVALGLVAGIALNAALSAAAGAGAAALVSYRAALLMSALALLAAGGAMLFAPGTLKVQLYQRLGPFAATLVATFVQGFGDRTQFLIFALAARAEVPLLAAVGGTLGAIVSLLPALLLGAAFPRRWPLTMLRRCGAALFLLVGIVLSLATLRLI
ncbi:TMEM165/GDT1 family protein [Sphingomonas jatrophae]|uniref:GDT1 family protein n=1 Tax=Sphingomonas jatrophae TaxID=1166337 RepID=A0A1I6LNC8_9SPHN|nr:TMEM165/GDT1 family protein [Sphingomonas jatrophae]SFS04752.1 Putative Ca2+/H+ antiporter, TMEM165/GDT1 family [Sphingomonas jatrophae]